MATQLSLDHGRYITPTGTRVVRLVRFVLEGLHLKNRANMQLGNSQRAAFARHREDKTHHALAKDATRRALELEGLTALHMIPARVRILRAGFGRGLDDDNLAAAAKRVRDGIAAALGVDDGGPFIRFRYGSVPAPAGVHAVIVRIEHELVAGPRGPNVPTVYVTKADSR